jgi:23S rRNA (adenine2503-C2)-methyltransferase
MYFDQLAAFLAEHKQPAYRLAQIKRAFFVELRSSWEEVSVYAKPLREAAAAKISWNALVPLRVQESSDGGTVKTLFRCEDGKVIEAVLMCHQDERNTVCVSSQVGCAMACTFCATGTMGLKRNLTSEEIVEQVIHYARYLKPKGEVVTNVVLMGMGEPLHNYDNVMQALKTLNDKDGFNFGARRMSISTCGVVPGILKLADEPMQVNLAISLHAATDEGRSKIMPVNRAYPLAKLMQAVRTYMEKTNRKVMFEYLLLKGINDRPQDAQAIADLLGDDVRLVHVNVIKYHDTLSFQGTERPERVDFVDQLRALRIPATHRVTFGEDIDAACGQLAVNEAGEAVVQGTEAIKLNKQR